MITFYTFGVTVEWILDKRWNIEQCPGLFHEEFIEFVRTLSYIQDKDPEYARIILSVNATEHIFKVVERPKGLFSFNTTSSTTDHLFTVRKINNAIRDPI